MSAADLQTTLGLSKGAASMITRELEQWETIRRVRAESDASWNFVAETDLMRMVSRVIRERESKVAARFCENLVRAREMGSEAGSLSIEARRRVLKLEKAASLLRSSMSLFLKTSRFDFSRVVRALGGGRA